MPKTRFTPLAPLEATHVVEAVLALDPLGNDNCPFCAHPDRRQLDIDLLQADQIGPVVDHHQLAQREDGDQFGKEFARVCGGIERHRRLHVIKVFDSLQDFEAGIPDKEGPTVKFMDWTVQEYIRTYQVCDKAGDQISALGGLVKALTSRAVLRGEVNKAGTRGDIIETEALMSPEQKRKTLELEARKLGLKLTDGRAQQAIEIKND